MQTAIVVVIVLISLVFLARQYIRAARGAGGCGCGEACPAEKRRRCASGHRADSREKFGGTAE